MTTLKIQLRKKFDWGVLATAQGLKDILTVKVKFELDTDFTLAQASLPVPLTAKALVKHDGYMVCQMIFTQEMTRDDLIELVKKVRQLVWPEQDERKQLCQNSKSLQNEKTTLTLESKDPLLKE